MDLTRKAMRAKEALASITRHDDEPADVRVAVLDALGTFIEREIEDLQLRAKARAEAAAKAAATA